MPPNDNEIKRLEKQLADLKNATEQASRDVASLKSDMGGMFADTADSLREQVELSQAVTEQANLKARAAEKELELKLAQNDLLPGEEQRLQKIIDKNYEIIEQEKQKVESAKENQQLYNGITNAVGSIAVKLGLAANGSDNWLAKSIGLGASFAKNMFSLKGIYRNIRTISDALSNTFSITNILSSAFSAMFKASLEFWLASSRAISQFNATSGTAGEMASSVSGAMNLAAGVDIEEAAQAAGGLAQSFTELTSASGQTQTELIKFAASQERLGIGAGETGRGFTLLTKSFGMTTKEAEKEMKSLSLAAASLGKTPQQLTQDFLEASKTLSAQGPNMKKVFMDLAATAKKSGLEMQTLLGIADKFDSFDSAADSVGSLNAILGGDYLNSVEMMAMTENERVEAVKRAIEMNGKSFDQMERYERKAIAQQLGVDTAELAAMMGYQTEESKKAAEEAAKKAAQEEKYNKLLTSTVDILTQFKNMLASIFRQTGMLKAFDMVFKELTSFLKDPENQKNIQLFMRTMAEGFLTITKFAIQNAPAILKVVGAFWALGKVIGILRNLKKVFSFIFGQALVKILSVFSLSKMLGDAFDPLDASVSVGEKIGAFVKVVLGFFSFGLIEDDVLDNVASFVENIFDEMLLNVEEWVNSDSAMMVLFGSFMEAILFVIDELLTGFAYFGQGISVLMEFVADLWNDFDGTLASVGESISTFVDDTLMLWEELKMTFVALYTEMKVTLIDSLEGAWVWMLGLASRLVGWAVGIKDAIVAPFKSIGAAIVEFLSEAWSGIRAVIPDFLAEKLGLDVTAQVSPGANAARTASAAGQAQRNMTSGNLAAAAAASNSQIVESKETVRDVTLEIDGRTLGKIINRQVGAALAPA